MATDEPSARVANDEPVQLIAELAKRPDDVELLRVFADWLQQRGHPGGELIVVQLARAADDSEALRDREHDIICKQLEAHMRGLLRFDGFTQFAWRRGLLDELVLDHVVGEGLADAAPDVPLDEVLRRLATDPHARLVRRFAIETAVEPGHGDLAPAIAALARLAPAFPRLSAIAVRDGLDLGTLQIAGPARIGDVTPVYAAYPALEELELYGTEYALGDLALPQLRRLALGAMTPADVGTLARAALPALEELDLVFGPWEVADVDARFRPLLARHSPRLRRLAIAATSPRVMQYFVRAVPGSELARTVRELAFDRAALDDDSVAQLVAWAPRLRALDRLEVAGRGLSVPGVRSLQRAFGPRLVTR